MRQNLKDLERCVAEWAETSAPAKTDSEDPAQAAGPISR
jgi:hypothetical protein